MGEKRKVPSKLRKLLEYDVYVTTKFCKWANKFLPLRSLKIHYKMLEVSCHGIPWICCWLVFIWFCDYPSLYQMQVNLLFGLFLDIVFVAFIKAWTRRRRPSLNTPDMFATVGPDQFSFPSGHASRACFVTFFFLYLWPLPSIFVMPLMAWSTSVCLSRILMHRHHLLDVLAGALLGYMEGYLLNCLWVSQETSVWILSCLSGTEEGSHDM